ncbi:hypothetical protein IV417_10250 [Alphaproteobacteria bacterium KMM 3653]|uniref:Peptidase M10 serralysin C-terminal domain-containing protein n=1 Tax=Harenicola maris TaxID=2841044 RepID=A0AAP2CSK6_9RHOB|nr:hypothetical protein [Harenicola maris]
MTVSTTPNSSILIKEGADFSGGSTSFNYVEVGDIIFGNTTGSDTDTFAVYLEAGVQYAIGSAASDGDAVAAEQVGIYEQDTTLTLYNSIGNQVDYDNSSGAAYNSLILYTPSNSGTYYIETAVYGQYDISLDYQLAIFNFEALDYIAWVQELYFGDNLDTLNPTVYFYEEGEYTFLGSGLDFTADGFNNYEISQFEEVFDLYEAVTQLEFTVVDNEADAVLFPALDTDENFPALGVFNPPGEFYQGTGGFNGALWDRNSGGDLEQGGFGFVTILHELLHGLGLAHPHDDGGQSESYFDYDAFGDIIGGGTIYDNTGPYGLNQGVYTTMTYADGYLDGTNGSAPNPNNPTYGYQATPMALDIALLQLLYGVNTEYKGGNSTYVLPETNSAGTFWTSIWDTGGIDTMVYNGSRNATIDLRSATLENAVGGGGYVSSANGIAGGYTIANAVTIENATGGSGNDTLIGNDFDNVIIGNDGADKITSGRGDDSLFGGRQNDTITAGFGDDTVDGGRGADTIFGGNGKDRLDGNLGNDTIVGGSGADLLFGDLGDDEMFGNQGNDTFYGGRGADTIYGGNGFDFLNGGSGADTISGDRGDDTIRGGNGNDTLIGNYGADRIFGNLGNDSLNGGLHDDYLSGGFGNDVMKGGDGADTFVFNAGRDEILDLKGEDSIELDASLVGNKSAAQIMDQYASVTADGVLLDFGADELLISNTSNTTLVENSLIIG